MSALWRCAPARIATLLLLASTAQAADWQLLQAGRLLDQPGQPARGASTLVIHAGRVQAIHAGHVTAVHDVLVPGGGASSLSVWLVPLPRPPERHLETAAWISAGGLGALALASAIVTVVQRRRYEDARDAPWGGAPASGQQRLQDARGRVRGWALATDLLAAASLASCGAALYARWQSASEREPPLAGTGVPPSASLSALVQTRMEF